MLHPKQFQVHQAWIAFQLNSAPLHTETDGDFNCLALMDAASCYILTSAFVPVDEKEISRVEARRFLEKGREQTPRRPKKLYIPTELASKNLAFEAKRRRIAVVRVPDAHLRVFIGEAREGFEATRGTADVN